MRTDLLKITLEQLFKSRLHFGDSKNKLETAFIYYLLGTRHNITIFDLEKLLYNLKIIYSALSELVAQRGFFFFIKSFLYVFLVFWSFFLGRVICLL